MPDTFPGRVGLQQRILPAYRAGFFDLLAQSCESGLSLFAGDATDAEAIHSAPNLSYAEYIHANNLHFLTPGNRFYLCWQRGLIDWLAGCDPDRLILEANPRYLSSPKALRWMHQRRKPVIGWGLGAPTGAGLSEGFRKRRQTSFLSQFDALITYSARGADDYRNLGFPTERIFVASNAVSPRPNTDFEQRTIDPRSPLTVLFVGRLVERKRVDRLIMACHTLSKAIHPRLVVIGDGPARAGLEALAGEIYPQTEFKGSVHGPDLASYYSNADLFVLPGTGGLAVQEAMSYGLPVIVAQGDGTQSDLVRSENGWNVPGESSSALTATLTEALNDPQRLRAMGKESYRIVRDEINLEKMVELFVEVLNMF